MQSLEAGRNHEVGEHAATAARITGRADSHLHWCCQQTLLQGRSGTTEPSKLTKTGAQPPQTGQGYKIHLLDSACHVRSKLQERLALGIIRMKCNKQSSLSVLSPWQEQQWQVQCMQCPHPALREMVQVTDPTTAASTPFIFFLFHINKFWKNKTQPPPRQINNLKNIVKVPDYFSWEPAKISSSYCWNNLFKGLI